MENYKRRHQEPDSQLHRREGNRADERNVATSRTETTKRKRSEQIEDERARRMARLRAENEQEETKLARIEQARIDENESLINTLRPKESVIRVDEAELDGLDEDDQMKMLLGFSGSFASTKGQKVEDNHNSSARGAAAKNKSRKYRQYMNRKNGFNRPLDKMN
jgi:U4/U6.U5 tri-snRNP-associated protein 3